MGRRGRRRSVRRNVALECFVHSAYWDGAVTFLASDLSLDGIWLEADVTLEPGDEVRLAFAPPGAFPTLVHVVAQVVRIGSAGRAGMGLAFAYMSDRDRMLLARGLEGLPPHLPGVRARPTPVMVALPA